MTDRTDKEELKQIQKDIGYEFHDLSLLRKAITHSSLAPAGHRSYERLEFLGDAVASLVIAEKLFGAPETYTEGEMTVIKSETVNRRSMEQAGRRLNLPEYLRVDEGLTQQEVPPSLITDAYEALIGAIFLDSDYSRAQQFVLATLGKELENAEQREHPPNYKSILQELLQAEGKEPPEYHTVRQVGPAHNARFQAEVRTHNVTQGTGWGRTKKEAEQKAAHGALNVLYPEQWKIHCGLEEKPEGAQRMNTER
ncbi:MAG: ribonuclease III [Planctomycetota bacterium]